MEDLKERVASFLNQILMGYGLTQRDLAALLGVGLGSIAAYLKGKELPRVDVLLKLAEIGGISMDDLLKTDRPPERKVIPMNVRDVQVGVVSNGNMNNIRVHQGDVYNNTTVRRIYKYTYEEGDLTEEQAAKIKQLVDEIVELEHLTKRNAKTHAAVYSTLKRYFKVAYYRKIGEGNFDKVVLYLQKWKGALKSSKSLARNAPVVYRKNRYGDIFGVARNVLGWTKDDVDHYIYEIYNKRSIRDLTKKELENLYGRINKLKKSDT
jgi:transcriptional regulator with XRE-family HTH domain